MKIQTKFIAAALFSIIVVIGLAGVIMWLAGVKKEQLEQLDTISNIGIRHMESDMMHDAMRSDILSAIMAAADKDAAGFEQARKDFAEHNDIFTRNLNDNRNEGIPENIKKDFGEIVTSVEKYYQSGSALIAAVKAGEDIVASKEEFNSAFEELEELMGSISDNIQAWSNQVRKSSIKKSEQAEMVAISLSLLAVIVTLFMPLYASRAVFKPLAAMTRTMHHLASGDVKVQVNGLERQDEMGEAAKAIQVFKENAIDKIRLQEEQQVKEKKAGEEREHARLEIAKRFEAKVQSIINAVVASASAMLRHTESISALIADASAQAGNVNRTSGETSQNVQSVASATEEMSTSVREISQQITRSYEAVKAAVNEMSRAESISRSLEEATQRIGQIVDMIQTVAEQINLLALNATIESARAGEAGKGFAVVAGEVKSLANQTTNATNEIASNIAGIQNVSSDVIKVLQSIRQSIYNVQEISTAISAAVEEQSAVTSEIARSMSSAAMGADRINSDIGSVSRSSGEASAAAGNTLEAARGLMRDAERLNAEVANFLAGIRGESADPLKIAA